MELAATRHLLPGASLSMALIVEHRGFCNKNLANAMAISAPADNPVRR